MEKWVNKVAVVTGASAGIGKDIALKLVEHGLRVVGCGRNFDNLSKVKSEIPKDVQGEFIPFKCDISKEDDVLNLFNFVKTDFKELSILINNAGLGFNGSILHGKTEDWRAMFEINVLGLCMCTREAFSLIEKNEYSKNKHNDVPGHIININSICGHEVVPNTFFHFYNCTKFAVTAITEGIRQELREANSNIRITQISPGLVRTEFISRAFKGTMDNLPMESLQSSDISDAIIYTLSTESRNTVHDIIIQPRNSK